jgi:hypothetical protein
MSVSRLRPVTVALVQCTLLALIALFPRSMTGPLSRTGNIAASVLLLGIYQGTYYAWLIQLAAETRAISSRWIPTIFTVLVLFVAGCLYLTLSTPFFVAFFLSLIVLQLILYATMAALARRMVKRHHRGSAQLAAVAWWLLLAAGLAIPGATAIVQARVRRFVEDIDRAVM